MKHKGNIVILDDVSVTWLRVAGKTAHKTPQELIGKMTRGKMALAL